MKRITLLLFALLLTSQGFAQRIETLSVKIYIQQSSSRAVSAYRSTFSKDSLFKMPVLAFRSNLLMPLMNVGLEIPVGNRWSLEADWYSPWVFRPWMNGVADYYKYCIQGQALYLGGRVWLGKNHGREADPKYRLLGHSIGISAAGVHYDVGYDYNGEQGDALALGVDYLYAMPLGKKGRVHMEFTLGVGGWWCKYRKYKVEPASFQYGPDGETPVSAMLLSDGEPSQRFGVIPFRAGVHIVVPVFARERKEVSHD